MVRPAMLAAAMNNKNSLLPHQPPERWAVITMPIEQQKPHKEKTQKYKLLKNRDVLQTLHQLALLICPNQKKITPETQHRTHDI